MRVSFEDSLKGLQTTVPVDARARLPHLPRHRRRARAPRRSAARSATARGVVATSQGLFALQQPCPRCRGNGTIVETPCPTCNGSGRERRTKRYTVRIPAGVKDGTKIKLKGKGEAGWGGAPAGDLFVVTRVEPSKLYERRGDDLVLEVPVTLRRGGARRDGRDPDAGRPRLAEGPGGHPGREAAAGQGPRRAEAEGRRPRRPARAGARAGAGEADEGAARGARGVPEGDDDQPAREAVRMMDEPARSGSDGRPRYMISVAAELVGMHPQTLRIYEQKGLVRPKRTAGNTRLYSDAGRRAAAADPAAHDRDRPQPGRRRAGAAPRGRAAAAAAAARPDGARDARGGRRGAPAVPPRPRRLPPAAAARTAAVEAPGRRSGGAGPCHRRSTEVRRSDGFQQADDQEPGGRRRRAGARAPPRQPRDLSRAPAARAARPGALRRLAGPSCRRRAAARRRARRASGAANNQPQSSNALRAGARRRRPRARAARGRLRLERAPVPRARARAARRDPRLDQEGARRPARHLAGSRGQLPGAREVRPRPDRGGRGGQARPGDRPRRGDPPRDPDPLAPDEEQPGPDRRAGRRQDGDRRGARAADRRRRRARRAEGPARLGARHRLAARRARSTAASSRSG